MSRSLLAALVVLSAASAAADRPSVRALWTDKVPKVDGRLDDAVWRDVKRTRGFIERKPHLRAKPADDTSFAVLFDADALYIAVWMEDSQPDTIRGLTRTRDSFNIFRDDALSVKIDAALDKRTTLGFGVNAVGGRLDYRGINEADFRVEFDAVWTGAGTVTKTGWTAEFRLPWAALGIDPTTPLTAMGLNFSRDHPRRNATYDWALMPPPYRPISASLYGRVTGFEILADRARDQSKTGRRGTVLVPYFSGAFRDGPDTDAATDFNTGLDITSELGGGWLGQLTVNTDFAQVDLDDQVVNLDRFGLFLPEKRDFFLNDLEVFSFGRYGSSQLLHTRRIGLGDGGEPIPILTGLKVAGRPMDTLRFGLLQVTTREHNGTPWTSHLVARGLVELGGGSNVGVMLTHRQALDNVEDRNVVVGLDGAWRGTDDIPLLVEAIAMVSMTGRDAAPPLSATGGLDTDLDADEPAPGANVRMAWRGELIRPSLEYSWYSEGMRTDLGFFRRVGVQQGTAAVAFEPRIGKGGLEKINVTTKAAALTDDDASDLLDWNAGASVKAYWESGWDVELVGAYTSETVQRAFTVGRNTPIAAGTYDGPEVELSVGAPHMWPVTFTAELEYEPYFGGELFSSEMSFTAQPAAWARIDVGGEYAYALFDDDDSFQSVIVNSRLTLGFTPDLGLSMYGGWNHLSDLVELQTRLRLTYLPGSDIFLVYQLDLNEDGDYLFQSLVLKATVRY